MTAQERPMPKPGWARGRVTAAVDREFVVLLIGMRVNRLRNLRRTWRLFGAMNRMIRELTTDPAAGYLGGESWLGNPTIMVQYWASFEQLERYARAADREHRPAWTEYNRILRSGAEVGVWHEAYRVRPGDFETVYNNMPPFGLARATDPVAAVGRRETAAGRLAGAGSEPVPERPRGASVLTAFPGTSSSTGSDEIMPPRRREAR